MKKYLHFLFLPLSFVFLEILLRLSAGLGFNYDGFLCTILFALAFGFILDIFSRNFWSTFVFLEIVVIWFIIGYFTNDTYYTFMSPGMIFSTADDVVTGFGDEVGTVFKNGIVFMLIYHIPVMHLFLMKKQFVFTKHKLLVSSVVLLLTSALLAGAGTTVSFGSPLLKSKMTSEYSYDTSVRNFGLIESFFADIYNSSVNNTPSAPEIILSAQSESEETEMEEPVLSLGEKYGYNIMDIDFESLINDESRSNASKSIDAYINSRTPTAKNEYTGLFEGKNLILICAEAFSKEIIDKERTPALYRLANNGIVFEDYYQPAWGGSTSTGEYSFLLGTIPTYSHSMGMTKNYNLYFTMGNQLKRLGYTAYAYHNGDVEYYGRNLTHTNLGYDKYIAMGNGMEVGVKEQHPESDLEMIQYTLPQYIDSEPFSIYYMTKSGHCNYTYDSNAMSKKNKDIGESMSDLSEPVAGYYAANQELEYALEYLLEELENAGILDDTVICLTSDHYPYGLKRSTAWENNVDYLDELYGMDTDSNLTRDHNAAIIWCGSLEADDPIIISTPTYSLDLLPTLSNLFGVEYDSRFLVGRDIFSDAEPLVIWVDYSWLTDKGYYDGSSHTFTPSGEDVSQDYIDNKCNEVNNLMTYSEYVVFNDYYRSLPLGNTE